MRFGKTCEALSVLALASVCALFLSAEARASADVRTADVAEAGMQAEAQAAATESTGSAAQPHGGTWALIVSGQCRETGIRRSQDAALLDMRDYLLAHCDLAAERITVLGIEGPGSTAPTAAAIEAAVEAIREKMAGEDRFIFYYKGQANMVLETLRLNLVGADMTQDDLARLFSRFRCASMLVVLDCPGAGAAVRALTGQGRIIVCGARGDQPYSTSLSECFVPALSKLENDLSGDGRVSLLEAYRAAVVEIDELFQKAGELKTENALLEDDGDGVPTHQPWKQDEQGYDGRAAAAFCFEDFASKGRTDGER